jgi:hypothetical protein
MEEQFCGLLGKIREEIDREIEGLVQCHNMNLERINLAFKGALEELSKEREKINRILSGFKVLDPGFYYPKISEVRNMGDEDFEEEAPKWKVESVGKKNVDDGLYKVSRVKQLEEWVEYKVEDCEHGKKEVVLCFCKKVHCKECLKERIYRGEKKCMCGVKLSPKSVHETMGIEYDVTGFLA